MAKLKSPAYTNLSLAYLRIEVVASRDASKRLTLEAASFVVTARSLPDRSTQILDSLVSQG